MFDILRLYQFSVRATIECISVCGESFLNSNYDFNKINSILILVKRIYAYELFIFTLLGYILCSQTKGRSGHFCALTIFNSGVLTTNSVVVLLCHSVMDDKQDNSNVYSKMRFTKSKSFIYLVPGKRRGFDFYNRLRRRA